MKNKIKLHLVETFTLLSAMLLLFLSASDAYPISERPGAADNNRRHPAESAGSARNERRSPTRNRPARGEQNDPDEKLIRQTALDYIEGWYEGNPERMQRALHPELAKRIVRSNSQGQSRLEQMGAAALVQGTRTGYGKETPKERQQKDVTILDRFGNAASVKIIAADWVDYLHLAKFDGRWVIVNVLWELKPGGGR